MTNRQQSSSFHPTMQAETASMPVNTSPMPETPTRSLRVFLCHATQDKPAVRALYQRLLADGIDTWFDEESLEGGEHWQQEIARAVRSTDAVIICLSAGATSQASHFHTQIKHALDMADEQPDGSIFIIPCKLDACPIPERLRHLFPISLFEEGGYERLLRALQKRAQKLGSEVAPASVRPHQGEEYTYGQETDSSPVHTSQHSVRKPEQTADAHQQTITKPEAAQIAAWQRMLANKQAALLLIEERISEFVEGQNVPLQYIKNKRTLETEIAELKKTLGRIKNV